MDTKSCPDSIGIGDTGIRGNGSVPINPKITVMIVDDEPIIRKALVSIIDWESIGCIICDEAEDGVDACEKIRRSAPDILITDVKMPGMDGIELAGYIHEHKIPTKVILLTGYAEFEFARKAINYEVVDFILKPTTTESVLMAVNKAVRNIRQANRAYERISELQSQLQDSFTVSIESRMRELADGITAEDQELRDLLERNEIMVDSFYILVFEIDSLGTACELDRKKHMIFVDRNLRTLKNILSLTFKDVPFYSCALRADRLCVLLLYQEPVDEGVQLKEILHNCEEIIEISENFMDYSTFIGISNRHEALHEIRQACLEADASLAHKFFDDTKSTVHMPYAKTSDKLDPYIMHEEIDRILDSFQKGLEDEALAGLDKMFEMIVSMDASVADVKNVGVLLCSLFFKHLYNYRIDVQSVLGVESDNLYLTLLEAKTVHALHEILADTIRVAVNYINRNGTQMNSIVVNALQFLNENYSRNINLRDIAAHVYVNSSYLSRLFKKVTGENITESLARIRIEKAQKTLLTTNLKTYEVAISVGIEDPVYFSQVFKKYAGCNPKTFRKKYAEKKGADV